MKRFNWIKKFRIIILVSFLLIHVFATAQILKPVKWKFESKLSAQNEAIISFSATIDPKWHLYSQSVPPDGPVPTSFTFEKSNN